MNLNEIRRKIKEDYEKELRSKAEGLDFNSKKLDMLKLLKNPEFEIVANDVLIIAEYERYTKELNAEDF